MHGIDRLEKWEIELVTKNPHWIQRNETQLVSLNCVFWEGKNIYSVNKRQSMPGAVSDGWQTALYCFLSPGCRELQMVSDFLGVGGSNLNLLTFVGIVNFPVPVRPVGQPAVVCLHSEYCTKETINKFRRLREPTLFHRGAEERGLGPGFPWKQCREMYYFAAHKPTWWTRILGLSRTNI